MAKLRQTFFIVKEKDSQVIKTNFTQADNYAELLLKQGAEYVDIFQVTLVQRKYSAIIGQTESNIGSRTKSSPTRTRRTRQSTE